MSDQLPNPGDEPDLQFDEAEYVEPIHEDGPTCGACKRTIDDAYYQVNGAILCDSCRTLIEAHRAGGSKYVRLFKASIFGLGASVVGCIGYFAIWKVTGWQIGLISIVLGFMIGGAVKKGSEGRGGWLYQSLAVLLTYMAICASYSAIFMPDIIAELRADKLKDEADDANDAEAAQVDPDVAEVKQPVAEAPLTPVQMLIGVGFLIGFFFALPVMVGFSNPITVLIVAFALWEAWKINRRTPFVVTGPHTVGPGHGLVPIHV